MDLGLKGKRALVTGASKGIGFAVAAALAGEGCHLELAARGEAALTAAAGTLKAAHPGCQVGTHVADLSLVPDQERLAAACAGVDILINNAGSNPAGDLLETPDPVWRASWDLKVFGYINLTRMMLAAMQARGAGVIVNIIGYAGERHRARYIIGTTSNAALMAFSVPKVSSSSSRTSLFGHR